MFRTGVKWTRVIDRTWVGGLAILISLSAIRGDAGQGSGAAPQCRPAGSLVRVPELPEESGVAVSRRVPGRLWTHNDSGEAVIFALDARGSVTARVRLTGASVEDWEAIAVGPCPAGSCVFVADIGDNDAQRKRGLHIRDRWKGRRDRHRRQAWARGTGARD